jgi:hypothetical protein
VIDRCAERSNQKPQQRSEGNGTNNQYENTKNKDMEVMKRRTISRMLKLDDGKFERAREFKYLGTTLAEGNITTEAKQDIVVTSRASYYSYKQLSLRYFKKQRNFTLCETLMRCVLS